MKRVVIVGAFDRYNYGDNIMPILFELFLREFYPSVFDHYQLVYAALTESDLSRYKAFKTQALADVFATGTDDIEAVISIGGEVLCAPSSTLFLHMNNAPKQARRIQALRERKLIFLADLICRRHYRLPWEYPYVPPRLQPTMKVAFNTVGGGISSRSLGTYLYSVKQRLAEASFLSVRDSRTEQRLQHFCAPKVAPDSAMTMAYFANAEFLTNQSSDRVRKVCSESYICFQASPKKAGASARACAVKLRELSERYGMSVKLCPIGYASGHDDIDFLREVYACADGDFELVDDLNVWEIMNVIKNAKVFIGTSLHGAITALSYSTPYIGLNRAVAKLDKFLLDWGIEEGQRCYSVAELGDIFAKVTAIDPANFRSHSKYLMELSLANNHELVAALELSKFEQL
ncbi:polysaccharide pyruvyl transferase family protein [Pseudidiomarina salilacus]|uniref:polysaccharide pyruvyl transferase family protein n=1 Tax=Pseudidiomarina salilacus TaxID=3384452 RepID=UPI003984A8F9